MPYDQSHMRDFCLLGHIDHGKSTLADRLLELTGTLTKREMTEQVLDTMDLEREKGVTIKASAVSMYYKARDGQEYELNMLDGPGHVDFQYEISRVLAAAEGAVLVVDATQGIEAQTLSHIYLALEADLEIIPVLNKIDLPSAQPDLVAQDLEHILGVPASQMLRLSAKTGEGVPELLESVVARVPPPKGIVDTPLRALIFDSHYDSFKGVIAYVRVVEGQIGPRGKLRLFATGVSTEPIEIGKFAPKMKPCDSLVAGEVGYVATGLKTVRECHVGDTFTTSEHPASGPLPGYRPAKPMVFASFYPVDADDYGELKDALEKLQLNDASLQYQPETSQALGYGFRCGFLGLFHAEIIQERLEREYDLDILATAPSVEYEVVLMNDELVTIKSPVDLPEEGTFKEIREPWMKIQVFTPTEYVGPVLDLVTKRHGLQGQEGMEYLDPKRVMITYHIPLSEIIVDFHDQLKARTRGYASFDYTFEGYRPGDLTRLNVLVNETPVDALTMIVHKKDAYNKGQALISKLKDLIPRQQFLVPIQATAGGRVISRANVKPMRKDVTAKCYGGDITRKRKLLEKQKAGKRRLKMIGSVEVPQEAFMAILRVGEE
jgi:GTP-binding protein LepA